MPALWAWTNITLRAKRSNLLDLGGVVRTGFHADKKQWDKFRRKMMKD